MKKILLLLLLSISVFAQNKGILFDSDSTKLPYQGTYRVFVKDNQPYLLSHYGIPLKINVEFPFEVYYNCKTLNCNCHNTYTLKHPSWKDSITFTNNHLVVIRDSTTLALPTSDRSEIRIDFIGIYKNFDWYDTTALITFTDSIYYIGSDGNEYSTTYMSHDHARSFFYLQNMMTFSLYNIQNKWYINSSDFSKL